MAASLPRIRPFGPIVLLCLLLGLAACSSRPDGGAIEATTLTAPGAVTEQLLVATTRARARSGPAMFSGERAEALDFADLAVSLPPAHVPGRIEWPDPLPGDPARQFTVRSAGYLDGKADFASRLAARLKARGPGHREVGIFVHGYNSDFDQSAFRAVQLMHDVGIDGAQVLFSWASRGRLIDYVYDRDSATVARDGLEETIRLAAASGAEDIFIFAHSMGNWLTLEALRQAAIAGHGDFGGRLKLVVLAAPDVDLDVFTAEMERIGRPKYPFVMFVSSGDQALALSSLIAGEKPRVGAYTEDKAKIADLGVIVVDVSDSKDAADPLGHSTFASVAPALAAKLRARLAENPDNPRKSFAEAAGDLGRAVGSTAGAFITLPTYIFTLPLKLVGR